MNRPSLALCFSIAALINLAVGSLNNIHGGKLDERNFARFGEKISQFHHQLLQKVSSAKVVVCVSVFCQLCWLLEAVDTYPVASYMQPHGWV